MKMIATVSAKRHDIVVDHENAGAVVPAVVAAIALAMPGWPAAIAGYYTRVFVLNDCTDLHEVIWQTYSAIRIENLAADARDIAAGRIALGQMYRLLERDPRAAAAAAPAVRDDAADCGLR